MIFPRERKEAIPDYGARALVFDSVSASCGSSPLPVSGMPDEKAFDMGNRAQLQFLVHENGKLDGTFAVLLDLDSAFTRALGQFLIGLADRAEVRSS